MSTPRQKIRAWWAKLTIPQALLGVGGIVGVYLLREHIPRDLDSWKALIEGFGVLLVSGSTLAAFFNGREAAPVRHVRERDTEAP